MIHCLDAHWWSRPLLFTISYINIWSILHILRTAESFGNCSQNAGRVGYLLLESKHLIKNRLLENESRYVIHYNQALQNFYTHERSWRRVTLGKCMRMEIFRFDPLFFPPFSLSLSLPFLSSFLAHFVCWAIWAALDLCWRGCIRKVQRLTEHCRSENLTIFSNFAYYRIKRYWNWKIACTNLTVRVVQKGLDRNYA